MTEEKTLNTRQQTKKDNKNRRNSMLIKVFSFNLQKNKLSKAKKKGIRDFQSRQYYQLKRELNKAQDKLNNQKVKQVKKIIAFTKCFKQTTFQHELIKTWHANKAMKFSRKVQSGTLGKTYAQLKLLNKNFPIQYKKISQKVATTKTCICGKKNSYITLKDRIYYCCCGYKNNRDIHSSYIINHYEEMKGCGTQPWKASSFSNQEKMKASVRVDKAVMVLLNKLKSQNCKALAYNPTPEATVIYGRVIHENSKLQTPSIFIAIGTRNLPIVKTLINSQNQFNYQIHVYNQDLLVHSIYKNNLEVSEFLAFDSPFDFNIKEKYLNSLFFSTKKNKRIKPIDNYKHLAGTIGEKILLEYANKGFDFFSPIPELEQSIFNILTTEKNIPNSLLETMNTISQLKTLGQIKEANKQNKKKGI